MAAFNLTAEINLRGPSNLGQVVSNIRRQLSTVSLDLNINPATSGTIRGITANVRDLSTALRDAQVSAAALNNILSRLGSSTGNITSVAAALRNVGTNINNVASASGRAAGNVARVTSEMEEFGRQSALAVRRFAAFSVATGGIYALIGAVRSAYTEFLTFNKEFVRLQQVTDSSAQGLQSLSSEITRLSTSLGVQSKELLNVSVTLAQAGLSANETKIALEALAKSALAPSFGNLQETVEGSIAVMRQFGISAQDLEASLGSINAVAAKFAVEADDIISAIQRTGGVFASASRGVSEGKDALNEFIAVFTSVRATTRESAETIATGLRTIFTRIQRGSTIEALREYGIELTDLQGKFVGPYEAVRRLSEGLKSLDTRDLRFSNIVEELGGFRQIGKVIPLIQQFATAQQALGVAQRGSGSLSGDAVTAQEALAVKITKVREEFVALIRDIGQTQNFQTFVDLSLKLASALISVASAAKTVLPALAAVAAIRGIGAVGQFVTGFTGGITGRRRGFATGGLVPGHGSGDTVPAMLTPGEFVIRKNAVQAIGVGNLHKINKYADGGLVQRFAGGGGARSRPVIDSRLAKQYLGQYVGKSATGQESYWRFVPGQEKENIIQVIEKQRIVFHGPQELGLKVLKNRQKGGRSGSPYEIQESPTIGSWSGFATGGMVQKFARGGLSRRIGVFDFDETTAITKQRETPSLSGFKNPAVAVPDILSGQPTRLLELMKKYGASAVLSARSGGPQGEMRIALKQFFKQNGVYLPDSRLITTGDEISRLGTPEKKARSLYSMVQKYGRKIDFWDDNAENIAAANMVRGVSARLVDKSDLLMRHDGGFIQKFAGGGRAKKINPEDYAQSIANLKANPNSILNQSSVGVAILKGPKTSLSDGSVNKSEIIKSVGSKYNKLLGASISGSIKIDKEALDKETYAVFNQGIEKGLVQAVNVAVGELRSKFPLPQPAISDTQKSKYLKGVNDAARGNLFEEILTSMKNQGVYDDNPDPQRPFDFVGGMGSAGKMFTKLSSLSFVDAKASNPPNQAIAKKIANQALKDMGVISTKGSGSIQSGTLKQAIGSEISSFDLPKGAKIKDLLEKGVIEQVYRGKYRVLRQNFATGGHISGKDTVPALLTPGEFVINKNAAQRLGSSTLHQLNNADKVRGYNTGGFVGGIQSFAGGGVVQSFSIGGTVASVGAAIQSVFPTFVSALGRLIPIFNNLGTTTTNLAAQQVALFRQQGLSGANLKAAMVGAGFGPGGAGTTRILSQRGQNRTEGLGLALMWIGPMIAESINTTLSKNFGKSGAQTGSMVSSTISGAVMGSVLPSAMFGPYGMAIGAGLGLASSLFNRKSVANEYDKGQNDIALEEKTTRLDKAFEKLAKQATVTAQDLSDIGPSVDQVISLSNKNRDIVIDEAANGGGFSGAMSRTYSRSYLAQIYDYTTGAQTFGAPQIDQKKLARDILATTQQPAAYIDRYLNLRSKDYKTYDEARDESPMGKTNLNATNPELRKYTEFDRLAAISYNPQIADMEAYVAARKQDMEGATGEDLRIATQNYLGAEAQVAGAIALAIAEKRKEHDAMVQNNKVLDGVIVKLDLFAQQVEQLGNITSKADAQFREAGRMRQIETGSQLGEASIVGPSRLNENIINNLSAYSPDQAKDAISGLGAMSGWTPEFITRAQDTTLAAQVLQKQLPTILSREGARETGGGFTDEVKKEIKDALAPVAAMQGPNFDLNDYVTKLLASIEKENGGAKGKSPAELAQNSEIQRLLKPLMDMVNQFGATAKSFNDVMEATAKELNAYSGYMGRILDLQISASTIAVESRNNLNKVLGEPVPLSEQNKPFDLTIDRLTSNFAGGVPVAGTGTLDPNEIARRLSIADAELEAVNKEKAPPPEDQVAHDAYVARLTAAKQSVDRLSRAQEKLATDSTKASNALSRIQELKQAQDSRKGVFTEILGNLENPEWLINFQNQVGSLERVMAGRGNIRDIKSAQEAFNMRIAGMDPNDRKAETDKFYGAIREILVRGGVDRNLVDDNMKIAGLMGGPEGAMQQAITDYNTAIQAQIAATNNMSNRMEGGAQKFYEQVVEAAREFARIVKEGGDKPKTEDVPVAAAGGDPNNLAKGGVVYASSGKFINFKPQGTDTIPAMLTPGEFVVNAKATSKNLGLLKAINDGSSKGYMRGDLTYLSDGGGPVYDMKGRKVITDDPERVRREENERALKKFLKAKEESDIGDSIDFAYDWLSEQNPSIDRNSEIGEHIISWAWKNYDAKIEAGQTDRMTDRDKELVVDRIRRKKIRQKVEADEAERRRLSDERQQREDDARKVGGFLAGKDRPEDFNGFAFRSANGRFQEIGEIDRVIRDKEGGVFVVIRRTTGKKAGSVTHPVNLQDLDKASSDVVMHYEETQRDMARDKAFAEELARKRAEQEAQAEELARKRAEQEAQEKAKRDLERSTALAHQQQLDRAKKQKEEEEWAKFLRYKEAVAAAREEHDKRLGTATGIMRSSMEATESKNPAEAEAWVRRFLKPKNREDVTPERPTNLPKKTGSIAWDPFHNRPAQKGVARVGETNEMIAHTIASIRSLESESFRLRTSLSDPGPDSQSHQDHSVSKMLREEYEAAETEEDKAKTRLGRFASDNNLTVGGIAPWNYSSESLSQRFVREMSPEQRDALTRERVTQITAQVKDLETVGAQALEHRMELRASYEATTERLQSFFDHNGGNYNELIEKRQAGTLTGTEALALARLGRIRTILDRGNKPDEKTFDLGLGRGRVNARQRAAYKNFDAVAFGDQSVIDNEVRSIAMGSQIAAGMAERLDVEERKKIGEDVRAITSNPARMLVGAAAAGVGQMMGYTPEQLSDKNLTTGYLGFGLDVTSSFFNPYEALAGEGAFALIGKGFKWGRNALRLRRGLPTLEQAAAKKAAEKAAARVGGRIPKGQLPDPLLPDLPPPLPKKPSFTPPTTRAQRDTVRPQDWGIPWEKAKRVPAILEARKQRVASYLLEKKIADSAIGKGVDNFIQNIMPKIPGWTKNMAIAGGRKAKDFGISALGKGKELFEDMGRLAWAKMDEFMSRIFAKKVEDPMKIIARGMFQPEKKASGIFGFPTFRKLFGGGASLMKSGGGMLSDLMMTGGRKVGGSILKGMDNIGSAWKGFAEDSSISLRMFGEDTYVMLQKLSKRLFKSGPPKPPKPPKPRLSPTKMGNMGEKTAGAVSKNVDSARQEVIEILAEHASTPEAAIRVARTGDKLTQVSEVVIDPALKTKVNRVTQRVGGVGGELRPGARASIPGTIAFPSGENALSSGMMKHELGHAVQNNMGLLHNKPASKAIYDSIRPQMERFLAPGGAYEKIRTQLNNGLEGAGLYSPQEILNDPHELLTSLLQIARTKPFQDSTGPDGAIEMFRSLMKAQGYNRGGVVYASTGKLISMTPRGTDTVPAMLTPGEFVVNAKSAQKNLGLLHAINNGSKGYSSGGVVYLARGGTVPEIEARIASDQAEWDALKQSMLEDQETFFYWALSNKGGGMTRSWGMDVYKDGKLQNPRTDLPSSKAWFESDRKGRLQEGEAGYQNQEDSKQDKKNPPPMYSLTSEYLANVMGRANWDKLSANDQNTQITDMMGNFDAMWESIQEDARNSGKLWWQTDTWTAGESAALQAMRDAQAKADEIEKRIREDRQELEDKKTTPPTVVVAPGAAGGPGASAAAAAVAKALSDAKAAKLKEVLDAPMTALMDVAVDNKTKVDAEAQKVLESVTNTPEANYEDEITYKQFLDKLISDKKPIVPPDQSRFTTPAYYVKEKIAEAEVDEDGNIVTPAKYVTTRATAFDSRQTGDGRKPINRLQGDASKAREILNEKLIQLDEQASALRQKAKGQDVTVDPLKTEIDGFLSAVNQILATGAAEQGNNGTPIQGASPNNNPASLGGFNVGNKSVEYTLSDLQSGSLPSSLNPSGWQDEAKAKGQAQIDQAIANGNTASITGYKSAKSQYDSAVKYYIRKRGEYNYAMNQQDKKDSYNKMMEDRRQAYADAKEARRQAYLDPNRGRVRQMADGGIVYAQKGMLIPYQPRGTDTVPAMLTPGEFVVNRQAAQQHMGLLKAINSGQTVAPKLFNRGGLVNVEYHATGNVAGQPSSGSGVSSIELDSSSFENSAGIFSSATSNFAGVVGEFVQGLSGLSDLSSAFGALSNLGLAASAGLLANAAQSVQGASTILNGSMTAFNASASEMAKALSSIPKSIELKWTGGSIPVSGNIIVSIEGADGISADKLSKIGDEITNRIGMLVKTATDGGIDITSMT